MIGSQMIKILFFASLKEQLSIDALDFPLTESITVAQLVDELVLKEASIDRDILVNIVIGAGQIPAYSFVPPVKTFQPQEPEWAKWSKEEREAEALRLYKRAGYNKEMPLEIEVLYNTSENHKKVA